MSDVIKFYSTSGPCGCFSNFSNHSVNFDDKVWRTSEHAYQAMKFYETEYKERILRAKTPGEAASIGRDRSNPKKGNWDNIKVGIMYDVLEAKFTQHVDARQILLDTGNATLIENSPTDFFWGCGDDGSGKNMLGKLLMRLRTEFRIT